MKQSPMEKQFSNQTNFKLIIQLVSSITTKYLSMRFHFDQVQRVKQLHELNFVHNDIKLENILVGHEDSDVLYLIDFGLATPYLKADGSHIKQKSLNKFSGNFMFASINSIRGYNKSRRDDIQSVFFVLIYLINGSELPWSDFSQKF